MAVFIELEKTFLKFMWEQRSPEPKLLETADQSQKAEGSQLGLQESLQSHVTQPVVTVLELLKQKVETRHSSHTSYRNQRPESLKLLGGNEGNISSYCSKL